MSLLLNLNRLYRLFYVFPLSTLNKCPLGRVTATKMYVINATSRYHNHNFLDH